MDRYIFSAVFEPGEKKGYVVTFPDLPGCITEGENIEEALYIAKDALELHLYSLEEDGESIPKATAPEELNIPQETIPKWLNDVAEKNKVNFSHVLQVALKNT